jgi:hypothetical protein
MRRRDCFDELPAQAMPLRLISFREALEDVAFRMMGLDSPPICSASGGSRCRCSVPATASAASSGEVMMSDKQSRFSTAFATSSRESLGEMLC